MSLSTRRLTLETPDDFSRHLTKNKIKLIQERKMTKENNEASQKETAVVIFEPQRSNSYPCPNCQNKGILKKSKLVARWNLENKLKHYKIEYNKSKHPLNFLKRHFIGNFSDNSVFKFNRNELLSLNCDQLQQLKSSLDKMVQIRRNELDLLMQEELLSSNTQIALRKESMELERTVKDVMKPYVNNHPLCEELARLMLA